MAKDNTVKTKPVETEETAPVAKAEAKTEKAFSLEILRKDCVKLFGITSSTFDGAFYGKKGPYTIAEAKGIIKDWKKEVAK